MRPPASAPRRPALAHTLAVAADAVAAVTKGRTPDAALACAAAALRPAALDLAYGTLRDYGRGDFMLDQLLTRSLKDKAAHALLLVALARLERRPEEAHTLVNQAVTAAPARFQGLTNAVLRNFLRRRDELLAQAAANEVAHWRHPAWWLEKLRTAHASQWQTIATAGNEHPPMTLRINRRRTTMADFAQQLVAAEIDARPLDDAAILLDKPLPVERIPGFRDGICSVQDWGAQQAARLLGVQDGMRVLDACAAPGGKTAHLLELADLDLTALEVDPKRAARIDANLARLGLVTNAVVADATRPQDWWDGRPFERILADVPCSASGVVRRHPDIKWLRRPGDVASFARTQAIILDALWPCLAPGGRMLYCTCSVFPEENDLQVRAFVARHADARRSLLGEGKEDIQLLPAITHDGFYYALLEKAP